MMTASDGISSVGVCVINFGCLVRCKPILESKSPLISDSMLLILDVHQSKHFN